MLLGDDFCSLHVYPSEASLPPPNMSIKTPHVFGELVRSLASFMNSSSAQQARHVSAVTHVRASHASCHTHTLLVDVSFRVYSSYSAVSAW